MEGALDFNAVMALKGFELDTMQIENTIPNLWTCPISQ